MKKLLICLFIGIILAGCGPKSNEEIAKDLIQEHIKATLPDLSKYTSLNYGTMGKAYLPFEESDQYLEKSTVLKRLKDSIAAIGQQVEADKSLAVTYKERMQQLQDSSQILNDSINTRKRNYTPEDLFKMTHSYKLKNDEGVDKTMEDAYYFDKGFTKVVKVKKVF